VCVCVIVIVCVCVCVCGTAGVHMCACVCLCSTQVLKQRESVLLKIPFVCSVACLHMCVANSHANLYNDSLRAHETYLLQQT